MLMPTTPVGNSQLLENDNLDDWIGQLVEAEEQPEHAGQASPVPWLQHLLGEVDTRQAAYVGEDLFEGLALESPRSSGDTGNSGFRRSGAPSPEEPVSKRRRSEAVPPATAADFNDIAASSRAVGMAAHLHMLQARLLDALNFGEAKEHVLISANTLRYLIDVAFFNGVDASLSSCPKCHHAS